jgi:hypothetical protein
MSRNFVFAILAVGCVSTAVAQSQTAQGKEVPRVALFTIDGSKYPRAENVKATIWTAEEIKKRYFDDPKGPAMDHLEWAPPYRMTIQRRRPGDPATLGGDLHEDKTQIYVIVGGSGMVLIGGQPKSDASTGPGEHRSQLIGATPHHVKEGGIISIPPMTWQAAYADPNGSMTFLMFHIENRQTIL